MNWFNKYDGKFYLWNEDDNIFEISKICFKEFEKLVNFKNNERKITEDEFYEIKSEFYKGFRSTCCKLQYSDEKSNQIWKLILEKIEDKRKDLFVKQSYYGTQGTYTGATNHNFTADDIKKMYEEIYKYKKEYSYDFHDYFYNYDPFEGFRQNNTNYSFKSNYSSVEVSFKYFEINKSTATIDEVNKKFRLKSLEIHPDKPTGNKEKFQECLNHKENCLNYLKGK